MREMNNQATKFPHHDIKETLDLFLRTRDQELKSVLVKHYTPMVEYLAKKYINKGEPFEDLFQVGMLGLLNALSRYDVSKGVQFESYATPTIIGEIKRYFRDKTWDVKIPRRINELSQKVYKAIDILTNELNRSPQISEIAEYLNETEEHVLEAMESGKNYSAISYDREVNTDKEGNTVRLLEVIGSDDIEINKIENKLSLQQIMKKLSDREKKVIYYLYFKNKTQSEVADLLGCSQMHISRIKRKAVEKLKRYLD
jgi:RNA polymerase sigma-B factor